MIIASGSGGLLWFWDLPTGRPLWKLRAHRSLAIGIHLEGSALVTRGFAGEVSRWVLPKPERVIEAIQARRMQGLRYRARMKRSISKLIVRRETIRALATRELTHAIGGDAALAPSESCKVMCTLPAVVMPPANG